MDEPETRRGSPSILARCRVFGLEFVDEADLRRVASDIVSRGEDEEGRLPVVVTPNVDWLVRRPKAPPVAQLLLERARWCLPDGQPIVWASRLLGCKLSARLAGSSLVELLWTDPHTDGLSMFVVASEQWMADSIGASKPRSHVVIAPMLHTATDIEGFVGRHRNEIIAADPALVFIGIGFPKGLLIIDALISGWPDDRPLPVFLAVGASFEMLFGGRKRAPEWMQRAGLEWFFRFAQEPRRLFVRYFVHDPTFLLIMAQK
jgi:N-acetylglucosaminyldiphosphoundecaprenol N-acetyl-beta-D-mannosaminyltransferase